MLLAEGMIHSVTNGTAAWFIHVFFEFFISLLAVFLVLLVLVQRGRGGGIAGALGGMGGNSAFGTKAGDTFTWITYGTAAVWILLAMLTIKTFTDPPQDKARMQAQRQEEDLLPSSPLDIGDSTDDGAPKQGDSGEVRDEGAFFQDPSTPASDKDTDAETGTGGTKEKPATTTTTDESEKTPEPPKSGDTPSDEPK